MNYYERYLGGYAKKTGHLELAGHGAYTLMLDAYYSTEKPLPADYASLYRICRAIAKHEQEAVRKVADEFFPIGADGLRHNERADVELPKAQKRINAVKTNGAKGGRPPKPIGNLAGSSMQEPSGNLAGSAQEPSSPHMVKPPDPRPHTPKVKDDTMARKRAITLPTDFGISEAVRDWGRDKGYLELDPYLEAFVGRAKAKGYKYLDWDQAFMNFIREDWADIRKAPTGNTASDRRAKVAAEMYTGRGNDERCIDGTAERLD